MEGPDELAAGLGLDEDIRLSRSMLTPRELHVVALPSSFYKMKEREKLKHLMSLNTDGHRTHWQRSLVSNEIRTHSSKMQNTKLVHSLTLS